MNDDFDLSKLKKDKTKRKNSKVKGNTFERKICEVFNTRFKTNEFCRSPGSGAFATTHTLPDHLKVYGDIITPKAFQYIIECKKGYNKEGIGSILKSNSILNSMIAQARRDSDKCSKYFLLILAQDRKEGIVVTNRLPKPKDSFKFYVEVNDSTEQRKVYIVTLEELLDSPDLGFLEQ